MKLFLFYSQEGGGCVIVAQRFVGPHRNDEIRSSSKMPIKALVKAFFSYKSCVIQHRVAGMGLAETTL